MKKIILCLAFLLGAITVRAQNILVVDTEKPSQTGDNYFTSLQAAINASNEGDIIHFLPSDNYEEEIEILEKSNLTIIGSGFHTFLEPKGTGETSSISGLRISSSSNILIKGVRFIGSRDELVISGTEEIPSSNIIIVESYIHRLKTYWLNGLTIVNSRLDFNVSVTSLSSNVHFRNNIITDISLNDIEHSTFKNNLIVGSEIDYSFTRNIFHNNIFAHVTPDFNSLESNSLNFINNFSTTDLYLNSEINGTGNIMQDVPLTDIFIDPAIVDSTVWRHEWMITPKLPAILNGGDDGTDIGPTGGTEPMKRIMFSLPAIYDLKIPLSVKEGEDIEVTIKAKGN